MITRSAGIPTVLAQDKEMCTHIRVSRLLRTLCSQRPRSRDNSYNSSTINAHVYRYSLSLSFTRACMHALSPSSHAHVYGRAVPRMTIAALLQSANEPSCMWYFVALQRHSFRRVYIGFYIDTSFGECNSFPLLSDETPAFAKCISIIQRKEGKKKNFFFLSISRSVWNIYYKMTFEGLCCVQV